MSQTYYSQHSLSYAMSTVVTELCRTLPYGTPGANGILLRGASRREVRAVR
ncbi:hypothetical protein [Nostoc sp.]|uniref:hypothetical protein n=1 Tax=Nostoc sp. TaxID=1180 RepID=UPI002FF92009